MKYLSVIMCLVSINVSAGDWNSNPNNWDNSVHNWNNSPYNWNNNPNNWSNNPNRFGNERIIRDNSGAPSGYTVPKPDGGVNYFDLDGTRKGYTPPTR